MERLSIIVMSLGLLEFGAQPLATAARGDTHASEVLHTFDDGAAPSWTPLRGTRVVRDARYEQTDIEGPTKRFTLLDFSFEEGSIEVDATVLSVNNANGAFGFIGVIWKYVNDRTCSRTRFGSHKMADAYTRIGDEPAGKIRWRSSWKVRISTASNSR